MPARHQEDRSRRLDPAERGAERGRKSGAATAESAESAGAPRGRRRKQAPRASALFCFTSERKRGACSAGEFGRARGFSFVETASPSGPVFHSVGSQKPVFAKWLLNGRSKSNQAAAVAREQTSAEVHRALRALHRCLLGRRAKGSQVGTFAFIGGLGSQKTKRAARPRQLGIPADRRSQAPDLQQKRKREDREEDKGERGRRARTQRVGPGAPEPVIAAPAAPAAASRGGSMRHCKAAVGTTERSDLRAKEDPSKAERALIRAPGPVARARHSLPPTSQKALGFPLFPVSSLCGACLWAQPPLGLLRTEIEVDLCQYPSQEKRSEGDPPSFHRPSPSRPLTCCPPRLWHGQATVSDMDSPHAPSAHAPRGLSQHTLDGHHKGVTPAPEP